MYHDTAETFYILQVVTIEKKESIHIAVHVNSVKVEVKYIVVAIQTEVDTHVPLGRLNCYGPKLR